MLSTVLFLKFICHVLCWVFTIVKLFVNKRSSEHLQKAYVNLGLLKWKC